MISPQVINWQTEWGSFIDWCNEPDQFMLSKYKAFFADQMSYFASAFAFLGCCKLASIDIHRVTTMTKKNLRKGVTDEFREVFLLRK